LQLLPESGAIEGIAKQVRSRAKAYPLFELARLIVQLSDRYSVRLLAENDETAELYRAKADGSVWQTRKEAVTHLLSKHLEKFYRKSSVTTEPPKGNFSVVAQCGMSGVLFGPPNHHEYTSRVIAFHAERFRNMPFEVYKSRIKMMRDEALIEQWKTEQSTKTVYIPGAEGAPTEAPGDQTTEAVVENTEAALAPQSVETTEPTGEMPAEVSSEPVEETMPEPVADVPAEAAAETTSEEPAGDESPAIEETSETKMDGGLTWEQVAVHFTEHHAENEIESAGRDITLEGRVALHGSTPLLRELLLKNLQEMDRFPLPLAQVLGKELTNRGLQLFKSHKKIINVSMARPRYLDRETTPIGENFRAILEYLEAHPKQHRDKQWGALLALRTEGADQSVPAELPTEGVQAAQNAEGEEAPQPAAATSTAVDTETLKRREQALGADLLWLLHQGHVIDFAMGNLQAATKPVPKTPASPGTVSGGKTPETAETAEITESQPMDETLTGDMGDVQQSGTASASAESAADVIHEPAIHQEPLEIPTGTALHIPPPSDAVGDPGQILPS
jgi:hypothetical protein